MEEKLYPMVYNKDHYTVMANNVIKGKQDMTLQEAKILRLLITQVVKQDRDLKTYTCKITDLARFLGIPKNNLYRDISYICDNLLQRIVRIGTGNPKDPWKKFQWVQLAEYDGNGKITLMLSEQIKPFVMELDRYFTQYKLINILELSSFYAIRLYELIKSDDYEDAEVREYTVEFLRNFFGCEDKYKKWSQFKEKVLDIAIREINAKTDLWLSDVQYIKTGRTITAVAFEIHSNIDVLLRRKELAKKEEVTA